MTEGTEIVAAAPATAARQLLDRRQRVLAILMILVIAAAALVTPRWTAVVLLGLATVFYLGAGLLRAYLVLWGWRLAALPAEDPPAPLVDGALPRYTVLVPLYREANVVDDLVRHLGRLDYPADRLEILLLCEPDDDETIAALRERDPPLPFRIVVCPPGVPKTKPRACNVGLAGATGELCVIFDAEDRPALDQLRRAAALFATCDPAVMCLQARLDYHNGFYNILTRFFTIEYNFWFDLLLPALVRRDMPIPLGGTSNHFRTAQLRELGGWDAYNVTEDADVGLRLYGAGGRTYMLDSVTLEEACARRRPWIRQRTRWMKGYLQTWLVHARHQRRLLRRGGPRALLGLHLFIAGTPVASVLNPAFWALTIYFAATRAEWVLLLFPGPMLWVAVLCLTVGNFLFIYIGFLAIAHRERWELARTVVLLPLYWLLMSIAGVRAVCQLPRRLHRWEKTPHGLSGGDTDPARAAPGLVGGYSEPSTVSAGSDGPIS